VLDLNGSSTRDSVKEKGNCVLMTYEQSTILLRRDLSFLRRHELVLMKCILSLIVV